jgi:hypothetical protein
MASAAVVNPAPPLYQPGSPSARGRTRWPPAQSLPRLRRSSSPRRMLRIAIAVEADGVLNADGADLGWSP